MKWLSHPYRAELGRSAMSDEAQHLRDMLELVLFTAPGERVHRPDFGCGLNQLVFLGNSPELAVTVEMTVRSAVQRWLGNVLTIETLTVAAEDAVLRIDLDYRLRASRETVSTSFSRSAT
ncbi:MAG: GPW/gp25 family protein [Sphingomonas sp.]|uniref:GPW/gp25 family protein n=1 Tax=Sphingomonas sp. TaxID=28214 RepID=UPI001B0F2CF2|nr:GPW/gp25 family protein [Sphingomonas sp.]MBO9621255.1 GPW/gp25 family protein [Sphingomonas sp.]